MLWRIGEVFYQWMIATSFIAKVYLHLIFSLEILILPTHVDKAFYLLNHVIKPALDINNTYSFENLLSVIGQCGYDHVRNWNSNYSTLGLHPQWIRLHIQTSWMCYNHIAICIHLHTWFYVVCFTHLRFNFTSKSDARQILSVL